MLSRPRGALDPTGATAGLDRSGTFRLVHDFASGNRIGAIPVVGLVVGHQLDHAPVEFTKARIFQPAIGILRLPNLVVFLPCAGKHHLMTCWAAEIAVCNLNRNVMSLHKVSDHVAGFASGNPDAAEQD